MDDLIVIPQFKESILASVKDDVVTEIRKIDISYTSRSVITENKLIVSICFKTGMLTIHNLQGDLLLKKEGANYRVINVKKNIVYLGGKYVRKRRRKTALKGEMFSIINLEEVNIKIRTIDLPIKVVEGKSIDDLLINGDELILVDNIIYPKYLLKYDISVPETPVHTETITLPNNGTYEHIVKGDINRDWLIIYSSTVGAGGVSQFITISGKTEGRLHIHHSPALLDDEDAELLYFVDIALVDNYLYILRTDGLGYVDLNKEILNESFRLVKTKHSTIKKLIKSQNMQLIAIYENGYELVK